MISISRINSLSKRFDGPEIAAIALMGSHASQTAGPYSDIDLVRYTSGKNKETSTSESHLIDDHLLVVSTIIPDQVDKTFSSPEIACDVIEGLRRAVPILDRREYFAKIQQRARNFVWDDVMQAKADRWASKQLVGWAEEVHKGSSAKVTTRVDKRGSHDILTASQPRGASHENPKRILPEECNCVHL